MSYRIETLNEGRIVQVEGFGFYLNYLNKDRVYLGDLSPISLQQFLEYATTTLLDAFNYATDQQKKKILEIIPRSEAGVSHAEIAKRISVFELIRPQPYNFVKPAFNYQENPFVLEFTDGEFKIIKIGNFYEVDVVEFSYFLVHVINLVSWKGVNTQTSKYINQIKNLL